MTTPALDSPNRGAPLLRGGSPAVLHRRRWWLAGTGVVAAALFSAPSFEWGIRKFRSWRSSRFASEASQAYRRGQLPLAELMLSSALTLKPNDPGLNLAQASMLLRQNRRAAASAVWEKLLAQADAPMRPGLLRSYALQLISSGWLTELADLALRQLVVDGPENGPWLMLACESVRLSGAEPDLTRLGAVFNREASALVAAYGAAAVHDKDRAQAALESIRFAPRTTAGVALAARLWLWLGDEGAARRTLNSSGITFSAPELAAQEFLFGSEMNPTQSIRRLLPPGERGVSRENSLIRMVVYGMPTATPSLASELTSCLREEVRRLSPTSLTAAWLYCGAARDEESERFWRGALESVTGATLPNLTRTPVNASLAGLLIGRVPLTFPLVYAMMASSAETAVAPIPELA